MSRIAIYIPSFGGGGVERNSVLIASELARRGHAVAIVVDRLCGPNRGLLEEAVEVRSLGEGGNFSDVRALGRLLGRLRPDVVYARVGLSPLKILAASPRPDSWRRVVLSYHNPFPPPAEGGAGLRMTYRLAGLLTRVTRATIAVSSDVKEELVARFGARADKVTVIHNPVDLERIASMAKGEPPEAARGRRYVLSAGRLVQQKAFPTLLDAFGRLCGCIPHDLLIIGEGPLRETLRRRIVELGLEGRVRLLGYLENPFPVFRSAELFALASAFEGFGNVVVEALALGVPVVATRCPGGPREILEEGRHGRLVPVGDAQALAEAMLATLRAPRAPEQLKARAGDFSLGKVADAYLAVAGL